MSSPLGFGETQCDRCKFKNERFCDEVCPVPSDESMEDMASSERVRMELTTNMDRVEWSRRK